jgi:hypothetical protein
LPQDTIYQSVHDTVTGKCLDKKAVIQYRDVIRKMPAIHDTVYRVDSSKNYLIYKDKQDCENDRLKILNNYLKFKNYLIALLVALLISVCLNIIQYKTKK